MIVGDQRVSSAENAPANIESNRHYEAAKTIILTEHQRSLSLLLMNERKLNGMPADMKNIVLTSAEEAAVYERAKDAEFNAVAVDRMKAKGAQIVIPDRAKFADRVAPIQDEVAANLKMTDVLQLIRSHAK